MERSMLFRYPVRIVEEDGAHEVYVRDLPEVVTGGSTPTEALAMAEDAIEVAVAGRIEDEMDLPAPSAVQPGEVLVAVPPHMAAKAAVYAAWKRAGISKSELARRLGRSENEARRILKPRHATRLDQLEEAARVLGTQLVVGAEPV
ncbi:type II toxin-antitoxin system HicB family antitoxin [Salinarimonas rosea]|uniref:type II toxin-antitoxin system HicB family antitoxin n=1 Tax=Salinarimonas rosea TaxID=552063 RepID=UPI000401821C|nr:type II toxin-antitoxin system HicB family antitoxin [Salinarimonas rosea]